MAKEFELIITYPGYRGMDYRGSFEECQQRVNKRACDALDGLVPQPFTLELWDCNEQRFVTEEEEREMKIQ